jgi:hypothetical protein
MSKLRLLRIYSSKHLSIGPTPISTKTLYQLPGHRKHQVSKNPKIQNQNSSFIVTGLKSKRL